PARRRGRRRPMSANLDRVTPSARRPTPADEPATALVVVDLDTLRALVREVIAETATASGSPDYYSQSCLPPGMTRRGFLDAIRRGDLPARMAGKARLVARRDYQAFVEAAPPVRVRMRAQPIPANDVRALVRGSQGK
ncbi:MAG: hypothetical protein R3B70_41790, partial [Polyangiaceae bacterium]